MSFSGLCLVLVSFWGVLEVLFFITHRHPLSDDNISALSRKRKRKYIASVFRFSAVSFVIVEKRFKSSLRPNGKYYSVSIGVSSFPSYIASLLKGKKHEWVVLGFVREETVICFWANKGLDNSSVSFTCGIDDIVRFCRREDCCTILCLHNHPNSNPNYYTCLVPSEQDRISAREISDQLEKHGLNWLEFVCERGRFLEYFRSFSVAFVPRCASIRQIRLQNNQSPWRNYKLHREIGLFRS